MHWRTTSFTRGHTAEHLLPPSSLGPSDEGKGRARLFFYHATSMTYIPASIEPAF